MVTSYFFFKEFMQFLKDFLIVFSLFTIQIMLIYFRYYSLNFLNLKLLINSFEKKLYCKENKINKIKKNNNKK